MKKVYRSALGKAIDMDNLRLSNEDTIAIGNMKVNARGDELGPGGKIIKKREEVLREANNTVPNQMNVRKSVDEDPSGGV